MQRLSPASVLIVASMFAFPLASVAAEVLLDENGCHYTGEGADYHCHEGAFPGQTFSSKWRMLMARRELVITRQTEAGVTDAARLARGESMSGEKP